MANILNTLIEANTNAIPARSIKKNKSGKFCVTTPPPPIKKYSIDEALKQREITRLQFENDAFVSMKKREKKEKKDNSFFAILSAMTILAISIHKKNFKKIIK